MIPGLVSIIVLNWNGKEVIFECLDSLLRQRYRAFEIILVDNGSSDGSLDLLRDKYGPALKILANAVNLGFAEGCNVGIRGSRGEFIALFNSDATAEPLWLEELVKGLQNDPLVGMCASKIYLRGQDRVIDNTGQKITRDGLGRARGRLEKDEGQYDRVSEVLCPSGCAGLYRRSMLEEIGLLDRRFFAYADDIDIGLRGRLLGLKCLYIPTAVAHHRLSASLGTLSSFKAYLVERNRLWVAIKCFPLRYLVQAPYCTLLRYFYNLAGVFSQKGPAARFVRTASFGEILWVTIKGYLSTLWYLPYLLRERGKISRSSTTSAREFGTWLRKFGLSAKEGALNEVSL
ncbi:MAG: glycosyltransferase family 2 protein [Candidatus Omnitrophica bacterium]|nr:glycosyltransferase family 2 protein [Candidatus Omnitrophota bacterium]